MVEYTEPKIYVADLAAYTNGKLHGVWINALQELDEIFENIKEMLVTSPEEHADEYAIHDYEGFDGCSLSEYQSIESVREIAIFLDENPDLGGELLSYFNNDIKQAKKATLDNYQGCYDSLADYAQAITEDATSIPSHLHYYIDYDRMGRDMKMNGDFFVLEPMQSRKYIFLNR
jgi:antirestriction protein